MTQKNLPQFPVGPFDFFALDVETANSARASICQIGVAGVRADRSIETWVTYVDPQTTDWSCTRILGITQSMVHQAPRLPEVLGLLGQQLENRIIYQHSGFDRSAIQAGCTLYGIDMPDWSWADSVQVARRAWPELRGYGGHGLASLKEALGLSFRHHDAGEDARAAAMVVIKAEEVWTSAQPLPHRKV